MGSQLLKKVNGATVKEYLPSGVEYDGDKIEAIYHSEGRAVPMYNSVIPELIDSFRYEYVIRDHLGNGRVYFSDINEDSEIQVGGLNGELIQENHYYPFGLGHKGPFYPQQPIVNSYQYNGKELNTELGLNWLDFGFRWYDPAVGRFPCVDPIAEQFAHVSQHNYAENSPISNIDLWGLQKMFSPYLTGKQAELDSRRNGGKVTENFRVYQAANRGQAFPSNSIGIVADGLAGEFILGYDEAKSLYEGDYVGVGLGTIPGIGLIRKLKKASLDDVADKAKVLTKSEADEVVGGGLGSYTNKHKSGTNYHGKGDKKRADKSAKEKAEKYDDPLESQDWTPSADDKQSFIDEANRMKKDGGHKSSTNYNKRRSPGEKYLNDD